MFFFSCVYKLFLVVILRKDLFFCLWIGYRPCLLGLWINSINFTFFPFIPPLIALFLWYEHVIIVFRCRWIFVCLFFFTHFFRVSSSITQEYESEYIILLFLYTISLIYPQDFDHFLFLFAAALFIYVCVVLHVCVCVQEMAFS